MRCQPLRRFRGKDRPWRGGNAGHGARHDTGPVADVPRRGHRGGDRKDAGRSSVGLRLLGGEGQGIRPLLINEVLDTVDDVARFAAQKLIPRFEEISLVAPVDVIRAG